MAVFSVTPTAVSAATHAGWLQGSVGASLTFLHCLSPLWHPSPSGGRQGSLGTRWHHTRWSSGQQDPSDAASLPVKAASS